MIWWDLVSAYIDNSLKCAENSGVWNSIFVAKHLQEFISCINLLSCDICILIRVHAFDSLCNLSVAKRLQYSVTFLYTSVQWFIIWCSTSLSWTLFKKFNWHEKTFDLEEKKIFFFFFNFQSWEGFFLLGFSTPPSLYNHKYTSWIQNYIHIFTI